MSLSSSKLAHGLPFSRGFLRRLLGFLLFTILVTGNYLYAVPKNGDLVLNHGTVFVIRDGRRCVVENMEVFNALGFKWGNVIKISDADLEAIPEGPIASQAKELEPADFGPPVYLAALHQISDRLMLHWKYNVSRPEFVTVSVLDSAGVELAKVRRPDRQVDVTGKHGPFRLLPLTADGKAGEEIISAGLPLAPVTTFSRIGIKTLAGRAEFVELATGRIFHPMGMNYIPLRNGDHAAFEAASSVGPGFYDPLDAEAMFSLLRKDGYNTVRVFLSPGRNPKNPGMSGERDTVGIYAAYLDNVADFLKKSAADGIHVIFNFGDVNLPVNDFFREKTDEAAGNKIIFTTNGIFAYQAVVSSTLAYLKAKNPDLLKVILAVQFNNEVHAQLTHWPFDVAGPVTTANGKTYDMNNPVGRCHCYEDGLKFYYQQVCAAVKKVDPALLTCDSVFVAAAVGRDYKSGNDVFDPDKIADGFGWEKEAGLRVPPSLDLLARSPLNFVDIHLYPSGALTNFDNEIRDLLVSSQYLEAIASGLCSTKPIVLGEFGAFKKDVKNADGDELINGAKRWRTVRNVACRQYGFVGYMGWAFDTFEQTNIFQAMAFGPGFLKTFREEFSWPASDPATKAVPGAEAKNPLVLKEVKPTGRGHGFLVSPFPGNTEH
jgi:hypothetical protein